jgi:hypothetical protein
MDKNPISLTVKCAICNHSLMDYSKLIRGKPSIKLYIKSRENAGILYLCSVYGCYDKHSDIEMVEGDIVELLCPVCKNNLKSKSVCNICGAPIFVLSLETGGKLHTCSRVGCRKHKVVFEDIYDDLTRYYVVNDYRSR